MPVMPRDGVNTRARAAAQQQENLEPESSVEENPGELNDPVEGTSTDSSSTQPPKSEFWALLEQLRAMQDEQARRQEEQLRAMQDEQARRQEEQARRQEDQLRAMEEQLRALGEDQRTSEGSILEAIKDSAQAVQEVRNKLQVHEECLSGHEERISAMEEDLHRIKVRGVPIPTVTTPSAMNFKAPPYDGASSWAAYRRQFEAVVQMNGWDSEQARTALVLGLRDKATNVLEAVSKDASYEQLMEALESRFGDSHLEHVFRAQLRERYQRPNESLQQWSLEVEKLVRKAYQSSPSTLVNSILLQTFVDGISDVEIRAAVRLGHHDNMKDALAHALEVEAVRRDSRSGRIREITSSDDSTGGRRTFTFRCYACGERGHFRSRCPNRPYGRQRTDASAQASENQEN